MTALPQAAGRPTAPPADRCPACRSRRLVPLLERHGVPTHTSVLLGSREEAMTYPRATLRLVVCQDCGLITNAAFDALGHDYSASYEEVQAHSARFQAYLSELTHSLVTRHQLEGRDVFEIGCGRGDFLRALCSRTGGLGFAVDPSFREDSSLDDGLVVERAFFAPEHVPAGVAAVVCRHTLEHIHDVASFLQAVRIGVERADGGAAVVFEVPDTERVLREAAFWDVFYEHCSYFTFGSLARAFRRAGLVPRRLERTFDDQYVLITGEAGKPAEGTPLELEEAPSEVVALATSFAREVEHARTRWSNLLRARSPRDGPAVIWGAGSKGVGFLTMLEAAGEVAYAVDVNPAKHGMFMPGTGHEIVAPQRLVGIEPAIVIVMNPAYAGEIRHELDGLGVHADVLTL